MTDDVDDDSTEPGAFRRLRDAAEADAGADLAHAVVETLRDQALGEVAEDLLRGRLVKVLVGLGKLAVGTTGGERLDAATRAEVDRAVLAVLPLLVRRVDRLDAIFAAQADRSREYLIDELAGLLRGGVVEPHEVSDSKAFYGAVQANLDHAAHVTDERTLRALARLTAMHAGGKLTRFFRECGRLLVELVPGEIEALALLIAEIDLTVPGDDEFVLHFRRDDAGFYWWPSATTAADNTTVPAGFTLEDTGVFTALIDTHVARGPGVRPQDRLTVLTLTRERAAALAFVALEDAEQRPLHPRPRPPVGPA